MKENLPVIDFLRSEAEPSPDEPGSTELLAPEQEGDPPERWARTRIRAMRRRAERGRRQHLGLLAYIVAMSFVQWIARVLIMGVSHKNFQCVDPSSIARLRRIPSWQPPLFECADQPLILIGFFLLFLASMAAAVVAWGGGERASGGQDSSGFSSHPLPSNPTPVERSPLVGAEGATESQRAQASVSTKPKE